MQWNIQVNIFYISPLRNAINVILQIREYGAILWANGGTYNEILERSTPFIDL